MKKIEKLPDLPWSDRALRQLTEADSDYIVERSTLIYQFGNYAVAGLLRETLIGPPWFWFLLGKNIGLAQLIDFRKQQDAIPKGTLTAVEKNDPQALRFAEFYGFVKKAQMPDHYLMEKV